MAVHSIHAHMASPSSIYGVNILILFEDESGKRYRNEQADEKGRESSRRKNQGTSTILYESEWESVIFLLVCFSIWFILSNTSPFIYFLLQNHQSSSISVDRFIFRVLFAINSHSKHAHTHTRFPGPVQFRYLISDRKAREKIWARICTPAFCQHKNSVLANIEVGKEKNLPNTESMIAFFSIEIENISILTEINETLLLGNTRYFANTQGNAYQRKVRTERGLHPIEIVLITIIMLRACEHMLQFVYPIALWR